MKITKSLKLMLKSLLSLQMGEIATDKGLLAWDGAEDLTEGMEVFVKDENEDFIPAPDGEYMTEDGKTIKVADGIVAEIVDPEAEVAVQEEVDEQQEEVNLDENPAVDPANEEEKPEEEAQDETDNKVSLLENRVEEIVKGLNQLINGMAALEERIVEVEGKLAKVEEPAADPIDETPEAQPEEKKSKLAYLRK